MYALKMYTAKMVHYEKLSVHMDKIIKSTLCIMCHVQNVQLENFILPSEK